MKHWFFYIRVPNDDIDDIPILSSLLGPRTEGSRSYSHDRRIDRSCPSLEESDDGSFVYGLYAWTSAEDTAKIFKESRNPKYFICKKMEIPIETTEWEALRCQYKDYEIIKTGYSDDSGTNYSIPMTHFESDIICDDMVEIINIIVDRYITERNKVNNEDETFRVVLDIFDKTLESSLDLLGWSELVMDYGLLNCEVCKLGYSGNEPDYLIDEYYDKYSYGLGLSGKKAEPYELDPINTYIFMLGDLLNEG